MKTNKTHSQKRLQTCQMTSHSLKARTSCYTSFIQPHICLGQNEDGTSLQVLPIFYGSRLASAAPLFWKSGEASKSPIPLCITTATLSLLLFVFFGMWLSRVSMKIIPLISLWAGFRGVFSAEIIIKNPGVTPEEFRWKMTPENISFSCACFLQASWAHFSGFYWAIKQRKKNDTIFLYRVAVRVAKRKISPLPLWPQDRKRPSSIK